MNALRLLGASVVLVLLSAVLASAASAAPFAVTGFEGTITKNPAGEPETQAGSHPYEVTTRISFATEEGEDPYSHEREPVPAANIKDVDAELPVGLIGDPSATPHCTAEQIQSTPAEAVEVPGYEGCPLDAQIGVASIISGSGFETLAPIWNVVPPEGSPSKFVFIIQVDPVIITASLRPARSDGSEGAGLDLHLHNISQAFPIAANRLTFWGNPADPRHDSERGTCLQGAEPAGGCPYTGNVARPFLTLPTSCSGSPSQLTFRATATAWNGESDRSEMTPRGPLGEPLRIEGCERLPFAGTVETALGNAAADSPTALSVETKIPQSSNPIGLATANLKRAVVKLPAGVSINPSAANGLVGCSVAEFAQFSDSPSSCPATSKVGTVTIESSLVEEPLVGGLYLARQNENPFGSLLALYLVAEAEGQQVKAPGLISSDSSTGQLTASFDELPQLPFGDVRLSFFGGPTAALATPVTCGTMASSTLLSPWSGGVPITADSTLTVSAGAPGTSCVASAAARPFGLALEAGTTSNAAGSSAPFVLRVNRPDGAQELGRIEATLPPGLLAALRGVPECGAAEAAAATCGSASQVGTVTVGVGAGSNPFSVQGGHVYLTGPYKGAPLGLDLVVPAVAGPLDLGMVNVRAAVFVDPVTARITVRSDELPRILAGIPLRIRSVQVNIDRGGFTVNPTSCEPTAVGGHVVSTEGAGVDLTDRFQAAGCRGLAFAPKVALRVLGKTVRNAKPRLRVAVTMKGGEANIARARVNLPHSLLLEQAHIRTICTRVQWAAGDGNGSACPAGSVYGRAKAWSPLLDQPLEGNVYLRANGGERPLPDLVAALDGQIDLALSGAIDTGKNHGMRATFESVPDAPISRFVLELKGGKRGLLAVSESLCSRGAGRQAIARLTGQNGAVRQASPIVSASCSRAKTRLTPERQGSRTWARLVSKG